MLCTRVWNLLVNLHYKGRTITSKLANCSTKATSSVKRRSPIFIFKMNEAFLRHDNEADTFDISFRYVNTEHKMNKVFNFSRKIDESVKIFLSRIDNNVGKALNAKIKKKKRKKEGEVEEHIIPVEECKSTLLVNGSPVAGDKPCSSIFKVGSDVKLVISGTEYLIKYNAPWVSNIVLAKCLVVGFPTYPTKFESVYTNRTESKFMWFRNNKLKPESDEWQEVARGFIYTPEVEDIGCMLKIQCIPQKNNVTGPSIEVKSVSTVEAGPGPCPFETRHAFTREKLSGQSFRVVSYNILADLYTDSAYSKDVLFPYCPPYALQIDYRKCLILKELIGYNSDIICLQEVDNKVFDHDLLPTLSSMHYDGVFNRKGGTVSEGISTFFNAQRFQKLSFEFATLGENVQMDGFVQIWETISNDKTKERFLGRSTSVQATALLSLDNPTEILVIGNTHLYFHPDADHIRLLQGYYVVTYVRNVANVVKTSYPNHNVSIILCGDFNSVPECGIYQLMIKKHVPADIIDWKSNLEEQIAGISLSQDSSFASACGTPQYTNFTTGFADCLDYIFYQTDRLTVKQVIPMPSNDELAEHTALPSVVFPSDHISLCADLKWNLSASE